MVSEKTVLPVRQRLRAKNFTSNYSKMVSQTSKKTGRPFSTPEKTRQEIWELWLKGYTYKELAEKYDMYRQKTRTIVLGFSPSLEDFKKHDENRRIRQTAEKLNSST